MKLSADQIIELLPVDADAVHAHLRAFEEVAPVLFKEPDHVHRAHKEGFIEVCCLALNGTPAYLIGFHLTDDGGLWVELAKSLGAGFSFDRVVEAVECAARRRGCRYIRFSTHRRGLAHRCRQLGYTPELVVLTKAL